MTKYTVFDKITGFSIGDPHFNPVPSTLPSCEDMKSALSSFILSASGWRKIFSEDQEKQSVSAGILDPDRVLAVMAAEAFSHFLRSRFHKKKLTVVVGLDSRFTGPLLADLIIRTLLTNKIDIRYLFISAAPETMAYVKCCDKIDGFIYITASHNPVGYNGFKFGLEDGSVLGGDDSKELINLFLDLLNHRENMENILTRVSEISQKLVEEVFYSVERYKSRALQIYTDFLKEIAVNGVIQGKHLSWESLITGIKKCSPGVVADMNGSARACSVDKALLNEMGVFFYLINGEPRQIVHAIVPEGDSLIPCKRALEKQVFRNPAFIMGYLPDNDGDRGNIVLYDQGKKTVLIPSAQEVFALVVLSELLFVDYLNQGEEPIAVVVNGPSSLRIEEIANFFNASVHYAEVGEANVVSLAGKLRKEGFLVRILGEGSNGGNITYPATVRDPMNTIISLLKLLYFRAEDLPYGLFSLYREKSGLKEDMIKQSYTLSDILAELPSYMTTGAYESRALMQVDIPHGELKRRYEAIFLRKWTIERDMLEKQFGIYDYEQINYEAMESKIGWGKNYRTGEQRGGFKIMFRNRDGKKIGFVWMRGSGTEPVFRVMADIKGNDSRKESQLLSWHKSIIEAALSES